MRVLVVEDDLPLGSAVRDALEEAGFAVDLSRDGEDGLHRIARDPVDAVVLDLNLPKIDGLEVLARARNAGARAPVLLLTARGNLGDRVRGLDGGADDYLVKPFAMPELLARLRALLRRGAEGRPAALSVGGLVYDPATRAVTRDGAPVPDLTPKETAILEYLLRRSGTVVTRAMISDHVWGDSFDSFANVIDVHVAHLRRKLERDGKPRILHSVRGVGFVLQEDAPGGGT
jgi:two-component system OmpR family response regulator